MNGRHASLGLFLRPVESSDLALLLRERHLNHVSFRCFGWLFPLFFLWIEKGSTFAGNTVRCGDSYGTLWASILPFLVQITVAVSNSRRTRTRSLRVFG